MGKKMSMYIYSDTWEAFTQQLNKLIFHSWPEHTLKIFFGSTYHGIKYDIEGFDNLAKVKIILSFTALNRLMVS